ncbi:MAG TPA: hypothetical protein VMV22_13330 [Acidimicrobiales bacterium]|nr:hypothetical protein [Acidimicrobiales bacterium]
MQGIGIRSGWRVAVGVASLAVAGSLGVGAPAALARSKPAKPVVMHGHVCTVVATKHHRKVVGRAGAVVCGVSGNDVLRAVGPGAVTLIAGPGKDKLIASSSPSSQDTLIGGTGDDTLDAGSSGSDVIDASSGSDTINCGTGSAQVTVVGAGQDDQENADCQGGNVSDATLELQGTVNTTDGSTTMNITYNDVNDAAQAWLDANGDPTSLDISLVGASIENDGGGALVAGEDVEVAANASGSSLVAVDVQAQAADG